MSCSAKPSSFAVVTTSRRPGNPLAAQAFTTALNGSLVMLCRLDLVRAGGTASSFRLTARRMFFIVQSLIQGTHSINAALHDAVSPGQTPQPILTTYPAPI